MLQITPQMRVMVAVQPIDGRKGIDSLVRLCKQELGDDPYSGCVFVFRTRSGTTLKVLVYDGQGFWLAQKRLSEGRFTWWPTGRDEPAYPLEAHQAQMLFAAGDPTARGAPVWRSVRAKAS
jgi:transposase